MERALDEALGMTFPASDPIAVSVPGIHLPLAAGEPPVESACALPLAAIESSAESGNAIVRRRQLAQPGRAALQERERLTFLVERDGPEAATQWARRTLEIYRGALRSRAHFARAAEYRRGFVESCCEFRRWIVHARASDTGAARMRR